MSRFVLPRPVAVSARPAATGRPLIRRAAGGFTLVELLTVIVIIVILMGLAVGVSSVISKKQSEIKARGEMSDIGRALEAFKATYDEFPPSDSLSGANSPVAEQNLAMALTGHARWVRAQGGGLAWDYVTMDRKINDGGSTSTGQTYKDWGHPFIDTAKYSIENDPSTLSGFSTTARLLDPWSDPYLYRYKTLNDIRQTDVSKRIWQAIGYVVVSRGADGLPESEDDNFPWQQPVNNHSGQTGVLSPNYFNNINQPGLADNLVYPDIQ